MPARKQDISVYRRCEGDTIPLLLMRTAIRCGDRKVALRHKKYGIWQKYSWKDFYEKVKHFSLGLVSLGLEPGGKVCLIGNTEPEALWALHATLATGATVSGIHQSALPAEIKHQVLDSDTTFLVVEDQEQVDKVIQIKEEIPNVKRVIYWDSKGLWSYADPILMTFNEVLELGQRLAEQQPELFEKMVSEVKETDVAMLAYTSGTTGLSKAAIWIHRSICHDIELMIQRFPYTAHEEVFALAHAAMGGESLLLLFPAIVTGATINIPEAADTVPRDMREVAWTKGTAVGIEQLSSDLQVRIGESTFLKRLAYQLVMPIGRHRASVLAKGEKLSPFGTVLYWLGQIILFRPLKDEYGFIRSSAVIAGGFVINPEAKKLFQSIGVPITNLYGMVECFPMSYTLEGEMDFETAGPPAPNSEIRIAEQSEAVVRNATHLEGYYKNPEATAKMIDERGWIHTGDAGFFTESGRLIIIDRVSDLMALKDGTGFSPSWIENKLKFSPYIQQAIITGQERDYVGALISINYQYVANWAEKRQIPYTSFVDLSQKPEVYALIQSDIQSRVNKTLPSKTRVKKFALLPKQLDADDAELTRTMKLRRGYVAKLYGDLIDAIYSDRTEYMFESEFSYEDGRKAHLRTPVRLVSIEDKV